MASLVYDSFWDDLSKGNVVPNTDTYYLMLTTSAYTASKTAHLKRSDVTNEVTGTGYTAGGNAVTCTVAKNTGTNQETYTFGSVSWPTATIAAAYGVIYKHRGGLATADELVAMVDFGGTVTSTGGTFQVTFSSPITIQN